MIRLFVSLELPKEVRGHLQLLCCDVPGARWLDPGQFHLTLRFIGEVEEHIFAEIRDGLCGVRGEPFPLTLRGVGHFPPRGHPRVLWAGVEASEALDSLHRRIEKVVVRMGLPPERRRFFPHVTLARLRASPDRAVGTFLSTHGLFRSESITIERFWLYSSQRTTSEAVHRREAEYPLGSALL